MKRAIITAGASGIGRAMAQAFVASGYAVAICDIDEAALSAFTKVHPDVIALKADVSNLKEEQPRIEERLQAVEKGLAGLEGAVNARVESDKVLREQLAEQNRNILRALEEIQDRQ